MLISIALWALVNGIHSKDAMKQLLPKVYNRCQYLQARITYQSFQYWAIILTVWTLAIVFVTFSRFGDLYQLMEQVEQQYHDIALLEGTSLIRLFGGNPNDMHIGLQIGDMLITIAIIVNASAIANWLQEKGKSENA